MRKTHRTTRRILSAGVGLAALTALGGLACGNPVEPRCTPSECPDAAVDAPDDALADAPEPDAGIDAPIAATAGAPKP